jgi:2,3-bisphosphoglycerate-independent phosphoglycerate mutase
VTAVEILVILDGAPDGAGSLRRARMPVLDALAASGSTTRVAVTPPHLPAGSETGIPVLLGHTPSAPVGRGWVDAAAYGVAVRPGSTPLRADVLREDGTRASADEARAVASALGAVHTRGHRLLLDEMRFAPEGSEELASRGRLRVWAAGTTLPRVLDERTVVVAAAGAAAGCARLLGARIVIPDGATGDVDTDLAAKARAALDAVRGASRVVVHVGGPDEAAHRRDQAQKIAALEAVDRELLAPLAERGGPLTVAADHGTCPLTGEHDRSPVTVVRA